MRLNFFSIILFFVVTGLFSCISRNVTVTPERKDEFVFVHGKLFATIFQQQSAEYRALCLQAFNIAKYRLEQIPVGGSRPKAIVTDIDETILDNSPYQAKRVLAGRDYDADSWYDWTSRAIADTLPGAGSFLKFAASKNIEVFYVTNRSMREKETTIRNLKKFDLPNADAQHVLPREDTASKEPRRANIRNTHDIVMLLGDNLADLSNFFDKRSSSERQQNTDKAADDFSGKFILLPNSVYGDWESALYQYRRLNESQKDSVLKASLRVY